MEEYAWPGNIRELDNVIRAGVIVADRIIRPAHLPVHIRLRGTQPDSETERHDLELHRTSAPQGPESLSLAQIGRVAAEAAQRAAVIRMLEETSWNKAEAARRLQVDYKALHLKIQRWGIHPPGRKKS